MNPLENVTQRDYTRKFLLMVGCLAVWGCGLAMSRGAMTLVFVDASGKETKLVAGTNKLPSLLGNIRADGTPALTQSVLFKINGESGVENVPPYYAKGDIKNVPKMHQFQARSYVVSAAAYRYDNARGANLGGTSVSFTLALGTPDVPPPPPPPPPGPDPVPSLGGKYFILKPGEKTRNISETQLRISTICGLTIRFRPDDLFVIDPKTGLKTRSWAYLDSQVNLCRKTGDKYSILCMSGGGGSVDQYVQIHLETGQRYGSDPLCYGVHVTGRTPSGTSEELHWGSGLTASVEADNKRLIDACNQGFPTKKVLHALGTDFNGGMERIVAHGAKVCGSRYLVKHNRLKAYEPGSNATAWMNNDFNVQLVNYVKKYGVSMGFEMVGGTVENHPKYPGQPRTGRPDIMDSIANARELARRAGYPPGELYLAIYQPDIQELR
jgi:hypothetical protein